MKKQLIALVFLVSACVQATTRADETIGEINRPITVGHLEWKIKDAKKTNKIATELSEISVDSDETVFVVVSGTVTNRSNEEDTTLGGNIYMIDKKGAKYGEHEEASIVAEPLALDSFNPNVPKKFTTVFEIPKSAEELKLQVTDFAIFGEKTALINLNLD